MTYLLKNNHGLYHEFNADNHQTANKIALEHMKHYDYGELYLKDHYKIATIKEDK
jgi:hypothetical protein